MSSFEQRIAEVLDTAIVAQSKVNGDFWNRYESYADDDYACDGPARNLLRLDGSLDLPAIAYVLVRELGLRQEWAQRWPYEDGHVLGVECEERDVAQVGIADTPGSRLVTRHVTDWTPDDF